MPASYETLRTLLADEALPCAFVDLDAVDHNLDLVLSRIEREGVTVRVASKSVRHPWLLRYLLERGGDRLRGLMTYSAAETAFLFEQGFDDLLLAYPVGRREDARVLTEAAARGATVFVTVDSVEQVEVLASAAADAGTSIPVCIDVDVSWRPLRGSAHFGVRRSPIRGPEAAVELAARIEAAAGVELRALLAYEAQVAGIREHNPQSRALDPVRRLIKSRSRPLAASRRKQVVAALQAAGHEIAVLNGGGTGSVASTGSDPSVTEVTAGSGFLCSHLFDHYTGLPLRPAAFFALPVVRRSDPDHVTCAGGGYIASGAAGADRLPLVYLPDGLSPVAIEGFGEVQTPFVLSDRAPRLGVGDPVICRHAKAGELAERFERYLLLRGGRIEAVEPTYRGLGQCFF